VNEFSHVKVLIIPLTQREASATHDKASSSPLPPPAEAQAATAVKPPVVGADQDRPDALQTLPLSEAIKAIGVPPGVSPADVGRAMTFPISDAAKIMGIPPGVSPGDVGKTIIMPLTAEPGRHP